jgi:hypothetical protein
MNNPWQPDRLKQLFLLAVVCFWVFFAQAVFAGTCAIYTTKTGDLGFGFVSQEQAGQPFTVSSSCTVGAVGVLMSKTGSPSDHVTVSLYSDSASAPSTLLETGTSITPTGSFLWATSTFAGTTVLAPATTYWVVLARSGAYDGSNYWNVARGNSSAPYADEKYGLVGGTWIPNVGYNLDFEVDSVASASAAPAADDFPVFGYLFEGPIIGIAAVILFLGFILLGRELALGFASWWQKHLLQ